MSKKHKKHLNQINQITAQRQPGQQAASAHQAEYSIIKVDLVKVIVLNAIYLAAILALYFSNAKSHFLDNWFARILNF